MATIALSAVGGLVAGPLGALAGTLLGGQIDRAVIGGGGRREGPRLSDLRVQSADYGAPIPRHYGTVRASGPVIWSNGLTETEQEEGGGKSSGGRATTYTYSASFAVLIAGCAIEGVGRIWADGKLLRGAAGDLQTPAGALRIYRGTEKQKADPLVEAALGLDAAPAHRGIAYAVFEDLQLADYANRIPHLSFEVFSGAADVPGIVDDLRGLTCAGLAADAIAAPWSGYSLSRPVTGRQAIEALGDLVPMTVVGSGDALLVAERRGGAAASVAKDMRLVADADAVPERQQAARETAPRVLTLEAADPARDYQPSLQRASQPVAVGGREERLSVPAVLSAQDAKLVAEERLARRAARRWTLEVRLPLSSLVHQPGDLLTFGDGLRWLVDEAELTGHAQTLRLSRAEGETLSRPDADGGAAQVSVDIPQGETELRVVELPPRDEGTSAGEVAVHLAAGGASAGWRYVQLLASHDGGASWRAIGATGTKAQMGTLGEALPAADWSRWDEEGSVLVNLLDDRSVASASRQAVLNGANRLLVGGEIVQYRNAEQVGARAWRLSGLLRGRRGTEQGSVSGHAAGTAVLFLDRGLVKTSVPLDLIGQPVLFKAVGPADAAGAVDSITHVVTGRNLKPLSPVHLEANVGPDGALFVSWTRRSRAGFAWIDAVDAPLAEDVEAYDVVIERGGESATWRVGEPALNLSGAELTARLPGDAAPATITVAQISQRVGRGAVAHTALTI
ncbi:MAG: phage tail protein [Pacificimonas sp.]|jgi:hypothetical protein|nr:phage tail protein [Pacificimonas sp.]